MKSCAINHKSLTEMLISHGNKILIMKPSSLGDIIHTIPVLQAIKRQFPSVFIYWFVLKEYEGLVNQLEHVDGTIPFFRHGFRKSPLHYIRSQLATIKKLRRGNFDMVLDFQGLFRSALFCYVSGAPVRFGFSWKNEPNRLFYNVYASVNREKHALDRTVELAKQLGIEVEGEDFRARFRDFKPLKLNLEHGNVIAFCPGGRWPSKRWPAENYALLAKYVVEKMGVEVVLVGSGEEVNLGEIITEKIKKGVTNLIGKIPLEALPAVLENARVVVTNDSGPMHLAAALGKKVIAFFGPTDPMRTGPYGRGHVVLTANVSCRPCFKRTCEMGLECMKSITVNKVAEEVEKLLDLK